jgi:hypothetical protein
MPSHGTKFWQGCLERIVIALREGDDVLFVMADVAVVWEDGKKLFSDVEVQGHVRPGSW